MTIYYQSDKTNIIMHLKPSDRWYMIADQDTRGRAHLFLNVNGIEAPLLSSSDFRRTHPQASHGAVLELYNAMVNEVFKKLCNGEEHLDLAEIEEELLPQFMEKWSIK